MNVCSFQWGLRVRITGEDTKQRVEEAAIRLFVQKSVSGASVRDIAREARVSLGAMYNHYKCKDDLAWTLFTRSWAEMGSELRVRAKGNKTLAEQLRAMVRYVFESFEENWQLVSYIYLSRHEHLRRITADFPNPHLVFKMVIVEAMARREIPRQNPDLAAAMVMGAIVQVIDTKILGRIKPNLSVCVEPVAGACARILGL
jgi:AcrR family transcriptional regulator